MTSRILFIAILSLLIIPLAAGAATQDVGGQIIESIEELDTGSLIKLPDDQDPNTQIDSTVYYYAKDGRRYVFPNEKAYFTWYSNYNDLQVVNAATLAAIPIGENITYKPGVKLIKFPSDPKVYAISRGGTLRWVTTEQIARDLYGNDWLTNDIDDVSEAFYLNYTAGDPIESSSDYFPYYERYTTNTLETDLGLK